MNKIIMKLKKRKWEEKTKLTLHSVDWRNVWRIAMGEESQIWRAVTLSDRSISLTTFDNDFVVNGILTLTEIDWMTCEFLALLPPLPIIKIKCMQSHVTETESIQFPNEMTLDCQWSSHSFDCVRLHTKRSLHCRYNYALSHNYYASERGQWPRKIIFGHWGACEQSRGTKTKQWQRELTMSEWSRTWIWHFLDVKTDHRVTFLASVLWSVVTEPVAALHFSCRKRTRNIV